MKNFFAFALFLSVFGAMAWHVEADVANALIHDMDKLDKGLEEIAVAKAKLDDLDSKLAKTAEAFGPEGKAIYESLKRKVKAAIKKGLAWVKKKFGDKVEAKRMAVEKHKAGGW